MTRRELIQSYIDNERSELPWEPIEEELRALWAIKELVEVLPGKSKELEDALEAYAADPVRDVWLEV